MIHMIWQVHLFMDKIMEEIIKPFHVKTTI